MRRGFTLICRLPIALSKIENIIREELDAIGCSELLMPALQVKELWMESGRWDVYGKELMRLTDRHDRDFCLGPTHEEVITSIVRDSITSYKNSRLPYTKSKPNTGTNSGRVLG